MTYILLFEFNDVPGYTLQDQRKSGYSQTLVGQICEPVLDLFNISKNGGSDVARRLS